MDENSQPVFHFMAHKAGMDDINQQKINTIILETSKNSEYYKRQQEKSHKYNLKVIEMKEKYAMMLSKSPNIIQSTLQEMDVLIQKYEGERFLKRTWAHFDMDMFFVACEIRDDPSLKDKPVAVGGMSMISTANYIARKFGVRSAMPGFIAKKLCPDLILIPGNYKKYEEASDIFKSVLKPFDAELESMGLDEANLDLTSYLNEHNMTTREDIMSLCEEIRKEINEKTGLTASCGVGPNKMIAKMASEIKKPNGQFLIANDKEDIMKFMNERPIRKIPGIGSVTEQLLIGLDIHNCSDVIEKAVMIKLNFTMNAFEFLIKSSLGLGRVYHDTAEERKSINISRTFSPLSTFEEMSLKLRELANEIAEDLQYNNFLSKHVCLQIKTHKFEMKSKGSEIEKYIKTADEIYENSIKLLKMVWPIDPVRLLGIKLSDLIHEDKLKEGGLDKYLMKKEQLNFNNYTKLKSDEENIEDILKSNNNEEKKEKINDIKEDKVPQFFTCFLCGENINSGGNVTRMNNHIDTCLNKNKKEGDENLTSQKWANSDKEFEKNTKKRKLIISNDNTNSNVKKQKKKESSGTQIGIDKFFKKMN